MLERGHIFEVIDTIWRYRAIQGSKLSQKGLLPPHITGTSGQMFNFDGHWYKMS